MQRSTSRFVAVTAAAGLVLTTGCTVTVDDTEGAPDLDEETPATPATPRLIFGMGGNLHLDDAFETARAKIDRAIAAGYTGVRFEPFQETLLVLGEYGGWNAPVERYQEITDYIIASPLNLMKGHMGSTGYGEKILRADPDMAEGLPIRGAEYRVSADGVRLEKIDSFVVQNPGFNPGFEVHNGDRVSDWQWNDDPGERTFVDETVFRTGAKSLKFTANGSTAATIGSFAVTPFRQYHVQLWVKTEGVDPAATKIFMDFRNPDVDDRVRWLSYPENNGSLSVESNQDWTVHNTTLNSLEATRLRFVFGVRGTSGGESGTIWFDDVQIKETGLVNLIRREGAPLTMRTVDGTEMVEGTDYLPTNDPLLGMAVGYPGIYDYWHEPPEVLVLPAGGLTPEQVVTIDHYAVQKIYRYTVTPGICNDLVFNELTRRFDYLRTFAPNVSHYIFGTDENRQMNWGADCDALGLTPGELLAQDTRRYIDFLREQIDSPSIYVYSDMFDPNHNAREHYYFVNGDLEGSWEGLDAEVIVLNWRRTPESYQFFADQGIKQMILGATTDPDELFRNTEGIEGIIGAKYENYGCGECTLENFAEAFYTRFSPPDDRG
jgi:hypothetical protein